MRYHRLDKEYLKKFLESKRLITEKGCWEWTGSRDGKGYGQIVIQYKHYGVHRLAAWIYKNYDLKSLLEQAHLCENPICFNPEHLDEMTHAQNMQSINKVRKVRRG
jgi:hypothetical protein